MRRRQLLLFGGLAFCAAAMLAQTPRQTLPSSLPSKPGQRIAATSSSVPSVTSRRYFNFGGQEYVTILVVEDTALGPEWEPSSPLPIDLAKAEEIARTELRKLAPDESRWVATDFQISRFGRRANWYYAVTLKPQFEFTGVRSDTFTVLVDFSGKAGRIARHVGKRPQ